MSVQKYHRTVLHQWDVWHAPAAPAEREMSVQKYHRSFKYLPPYYICVYVDVCVCVCVSMCKWSLWQPSDPPPLQNGGWVFKYPARVCHHQTKLAEARPLGGMPPLLPWVMSVQISEGAVQKTEAPQKPRKEDDDRSKIHHYIYVCLFVCLCVCVYVSSVVVAERESNISGSVQKSYIY